jgi:hypothetical protein
LPREIIDNQLVVGLQRAEIDPRNGGTDHQA